MRTRPLEPFSSGFVAAPKRCNLHRANLIFLPSFYCPSLAEKPREHSTLNGQTLWPGDKKNGQIVHRKWPEKGVQKNRERCCMVDQSLCIKVMVNILSQRSLHKARDATYRNGKSQEKKAMK